MTNRYIALLVILVCFITNSLSAQITPPEILCVRADTIFWELPSNNCGSFQSYEIYFSDTQPGPYSLLATITDAAETRFEDAGSSGQLRFYYMRSIYDCPGKPIVNSDTIDNQLPATVPLRYASVSDSGVALSWDASLSPEVVGYIIYRNTTQGIQPQDTVFAPDISYLDTTVNANLASFTYYILALDGCGNTSIFDNPHTTILPGFTVNTCTQTAAFTWNAYDGWSAAPDRYEIWASEGQGDLVLVGQVSGQSTSYDYTDLLDSTEYCVEIRAIRNGEPDTAVSAQVCFTAEVVEPTLQLEISSLTVNEDNTVSLGWEWNTSAQLNSVEVWSYEPNDLQSFLLDASLPMLPLQSSPSFTTSDPFGLQQRYYFIETQDVCDTVYTSQAVSPVLATARFTDNNEYEIRWTAIDWPGFEFDNYEVYRVADNGVSPLIGQVATGEERILTDMGEKNAVENCFYIEARGNYVSAQTGEVSGTRSRSNVVCVEQDAIVFIPNAFAPLGLNEVFMPIISLGEVTLTEYSLQIYDRWGKLLFESNDVDTGWTGFHNGQLLAQDVYTYKMKLVQQSGRVLQKSGVVMLVK